MEITQNKTKFRRFHFPHFTIIGTLAGIGVISIISGIIASPFLGWKFYQAQKQNEVVKIAQTAWNTYWEKEKDASGNKLITPPIQSGVIQYPNALLFPYNDPTTGKLSVLAWLNNPKLDQEGLRDVWFPLQVQVQEKTPEAVTTPEAGKINDTKK